MITQLVLTAVLAVCFYLIVQYAISPAPFDKVVKWLLSAIAVIIFVVAILNVWGISVG